MQEQIYISIKKQIKIYNTSSKIQATLKKKFKSIYPFVIISRAINHFTRWNETFSLLLIEPLINHFLIQLLIYFFPTKEMYGTFFFNLYIDNKNLQI